MASKRDRILKSAEKLVQKGKLEQAIREYEKLLKASPDDTNTYNRLGDLYGRVNEIDKAVEAYERVAQQFAEQGFIPKAIAIYKKINRLAPHRLDIFERLGELYIEQGLVVEAKGQFQMLAEHYVKNEDIESALRVHQRLGDIDPNDTTARLKFADLLLETGDTEQAMTAYGDLGEALIKRDQLDEAERLYKRLLEHDLPDGEFLAPICVRLLDAGRMTSAQELLTAGLEVSPDNIPLRTLQVRAYMTQGDTDAAVDLAKEVLEVDPENPEVRGLVGGVMISDGDEEQATEMMIPAAEALLDQADYARAQKMLEELVEVSPDDERVLRLAIRAFRPSGDQETLSRLTAALADVCFNTGQNDQAKRFYLELVATDPTNQLYRERLAHLDGVDIDVTENAVTSGGIPSEEIPAEIDFVLDDETEIDLGAVEEPEAPPSFDPSERIGEAAVFAKYGLHDKAVAHLKEVVRQMPDSLEAREALANELVEVGDEELAAQTIRPVIESHRDSGHEEEASKLEALFGIEEPAADGMADEIVVEDDEVIIVDIDDDEVVEVIDVDEVVEAAEVVEVAEAAEVVDAAEVVEVVDVDEVVEAAEVVEIDEPESPPDEQKVEVPAGDSDSSAIDELVAKAVGDIADTSSPARPMDYSVAADATDALLADAMASQPVESEPEVVEPEVVKEELIEITTGVDGPSSSELAQLDLFVEQDLLGDAVGTLEYLETEYPDDAELADRRQRLESLGAWDEAPAVEETPPVEEAVTEVEEEPAAVEAIRRGSATEVEAPVEQTPEELFEDEVEDEYIDLASELEQELAEEEAMVEEATGRGKGEALLEEVFREFQKGVAEQLSEEDSDTHFNLGIAYKEMGLLEEAIAEFTVASHDPIYFVEACTMIGVCSIDLGKHAEAAEWYQKALVAPELTMDARTALRYELASAFEQSGNMDQAAGLFEQIIEHDPSFRDASARLTALTQQRQAN